ncbi:hypothetical protein ACFL2Y_04960, partial [Candidatus Omnitrophota bacterium]
LIGEKFKPTNPSGIFEKLSAIFLGKLVRGETVIRKETTTKKTKKRSIVLFFFSTFQKLC